MSIFILQALRLILHYELTMKTKKRNIEDKPDLSLEFCTECDSALESFVFTPKSKSKKKIQDNFNNCKKTGKFKGELCSKVFISEDQIFIHSPEDEE